MSIKSYITDPKTGRKAEVIDGDNEKHALVVATRPLKTYENSVRFFTNDAYGADMNQDIGAFGTPEKIHDGTDSILWTASDIVGGGKTTFNSSDRNHTSGGALSVKVDNSPVNDIFQFDKGSDLDLSGYVSISSWINVDKDWKAGDDIEIYGWDTGTNLQVGDSVGLQNYFDFSSYDTWHKLNIALEDMSIEESTLDALRVRIVAAEGKSPKFYLDDIQFEQTGAPIPFELRADKGTWLYVDEFTISVVDEIAGTLADATMPFLSYDKLLGVTLTVGITYQRIQSEEVQFSIQAKGLIDFVQLSGTEVVGQGSDGTNTWITLRSQFMEPLVLKHENDDILRFIINDDMSGLLHFRISAGCKIEDRSEYL